MIASRRGSTKSSTWTTRWRSAVGRSTGRFLEERFGAVYPAKAGDPPPTLLMAGLSFLKHMHDLANEDLCAPWVENPYHQLFWLGPI